MYLKLYMQKNNTQSVNNHIKLKSVITKRKYNSNL